jgi:membrane protein implicated in regulation of membrane protease activity
MKKMQRNLTLIFIMAIASFIGWLKGDEAKQKWVYKWRSSYEQKRQLAQKRIAERKGKVQLDDFEWSSYHEN